MRDRLLRRIIELLTAQPWLTAAQLAAAIADAAVTRSDVNSILHRHRDDLFERDESRTPPRWALRAGVSSGRASTAEGGGSPSARPTRPKGSVYSGPGLRDWQRAALDAWGSHDHRAVIESVDGSGKTLVGVAAAAEAVDAGRRAVVLVSGVEQQDRWSRVLQSSLPTCRVERLGGSGKAVTTADVVVGPAAALARTRFGRAGDVIPTVLIVDDVHNYGPGTYAKALDDGYQWRLGLTAALERSDDLVESVLLPYFGTIIPGCDYARAVTDGLLPKIRVVQVEVQLTDAEATKLHQLEAQIEHLTDMLVGNYGAPDPHSSAFDKFVRSLAGGRYAAAQYAKKYLNAIADHTALLAECKAKSDLVRALPPALPDHTQMILFTDRASSAGHIARALTDQGLTAAISGVGAAKSDRDAVALGLREGTIRALVEPRTLDESLVVPEAGLGVILTSARSDRQMIQRMGRLIRPNRPHPIVFVVAIVQGTPEDPAQGSARSHLRLLWQIAERAAKTDASRAPDILRRMLRPDEPVDAETTTDTSANRSTSASPPVAATVRPSVPSNPAGAQRVPVDSSGSQQPAQPLAEPTSVPSATSASVPEIAEPAPSNTMDPTFDMTVELVGQLHTQGGIATADEVGDLIGLTDPDDMRAVVAAAAAQGQLDFSPIEDGADELILLSAEAGGTPAQRRDAAAAVAEWAVRADDPIDEFHDLVTRLGPIRVCDHRLIQIAAFLRGTTPIALL